MTEKEFKELCSKTSSGTTLTFSFGDRQVSGKFVGCAEDAVVIEANGRSFVWPRELCSYRTTSNQVPSYS